MEGNKSAHSIILPNLRRRVRSDISFPRFDFVNFYNFPKFYTIIHVHICIVSHTLFLQILPADTSKNKLQFVEVFCIKIIEN